MLLPKLVFRAYYTRIIVVEAISSKTIKFSMRVGFNLYLHFYSVILPMLGVILWVFLTLDVSMMATNSTLTNAAFGSVI